MTYAEYLAAEEKAEVKHEYWQGEVWERGDAAGEQASENRIDHGALTVAFGAAVVSALAGRPCRVLNSDVGVRVVGTDRATYPDLSVICGKIETAPDDPQAITNPVLIVEVLSPSTQADDYGEKFAHYRRLPSLREYVLVGQNPNRIEVFRLDGERWSLYDFRAGDTVQLASVDCRLSVDAVFRDPLA